jgi:PmbA protein
MDLADAADLVLRRASARAGIEAEVVAAEADRLEAGVRLGKPEKLKRSSERRLALRVFAGPSSALVSSADLTAAALETLVDDAVDLARATAADPFAGLPDLEGQPAPLEDLDLFDPRACEMSAEDALSVARIAEEAALSCDPRLSNSEGAAFSAAARVLLYATSRGFRGEQRSSSFSLSVVPVAKSDGSMQRDYWYASARYLDDLDDAADIGRIAAARTLRRLGARSAPTGDVPVVFENEVAASLVGHIAAAVSGSSVYRGLSFLANRIGERIAPSFVRVVDDPLRPRGLASRPFDAEGVASRTNVVIDGGALQTFLLDTYSARKLGRRSTASAVRSLGEPPLAGATNMYLAPGVDSAEAIVRSVRKGLLVTELIGSGVNGVTGDYSRGAAGLWIENGEPAFPVEGITIAGNLLDMLGGIETIGDDLRFRSSVSAPTVKLARMTVAGTG